MRATKKAAAFAEEFRTVQQTWLHCKALHHAGVETADTFISFSPAPALEAEFRCRVGALVGNVIKRKKIDAFRIAFTKYMLTS